MSDHDPSASPAASRHGAVEERSAARLAVDEKFSFFYRATLRQLVGFLVNQGAALSVATDIAQDTMTKAYQRWSEIDQPKAWVHTVASRALIRMMTRTHEEPLDHVLEATALLPCHNAAAEWEAQYDTLGILRSLPLRQRQILAWTLSGYTPSEIAEQLRITPNAVSASLKKARRAVAQHLMTRDGEQ